MEIFTHELFDAATLNSLRSILLDGEQFWEDGRKTAGVQAAKVKNNLQLDRNSDVAKKASELVINQLKSDPLIKSFSLLRRIHGVMFSRTGVGQGYGMHVDNAFMSSGRSDLSFTLFLNSPKEYEGGELCIQNIQEIKEIKLPAGQVLIYPSTSLHCVKPVEKGERLVCVGWIQSHIASNEDRLIMFGLEAGAKGMLAKHGQSQELDLVFQSYNNLLRRLGD